MKKIFKLFTIICLFLLMFSVSACDSKGDNKEPAEVKLSKEEAYAAIKNSLSGTITNANAISAKFVGDVTLNLEQVDEMEFEKANVDVCIQMKADENRKLTGRCCWIKLGDDESSLILESYVKDGYEYGYTNLFGDSYTYGEADPEEEFDASEIDLTEVNKAVDDLMEYLPEPESKSYKEDEQEYTSIKWTVTLENLATYVAAIQYVADNDDMTFEEILAEKQNDINEGAEGFVVETGYIEITLKEGHFYTLKACLKATKGEQIVDINISCEFEYDDFEFAYPENRLAEIKAGEEAEQAAKEK